MSTRTFKALLLTLAVLSRQAVSIEVHAKISAEPAVTYLFRTIGQVLGVALSAALIQTIVTRDLTKSITGPEASDIIYLIRHSTSAIKHLEPVYRDAAVRAYEHALHLVFLANAALAVLNVLVLMGMKEEPMPDSEEPVKPSSRSEA